MLLRENSSKTYSRNNNEENRIAAVETQPYTLIQIQQALAKMVLFWVFVQASVVLLLLLLFGGFFSSINKFMVGCNPNLRRNTRKHFRRPKRASYIIVAGRGPYIHSIVYYTVYVYKCLCAFHRLDYITLWPQYKNVGENIVPLLTEEQNTQSFFFFFKRYTIMCFMHSIPPILCFTLSSNKPMSLPIV